VELKGLQQGNSGRLTDDVVQTLTRGVGQPYNQTELGRKGLLGTQQARAAAATLIGMPQQQYAEVSSLLGKAGSDTERMLLLKAVGAREKRLTNPSDPKFQQSMGELRDYAAQIRGRPPQQLIQRSTVLDVDGTMEGLRQRWDSGCGPTTAMMCRAQSDPIYAARLHDGSTRVGDSMDDVGRVGQQQKKWLAQHGDTTATSVRDIRQHGAKDEGKGLTRTPLSKLLNRHVAKATNQVYTPSVAKTREELQKALDGVDARLKQGVDVPVGASIGGPGGGHWMLLSDVRGKGADRSYLLTDPNGYARWIPKKDLLDGTAQWTRMNGTKESIGLEDFLL
jgi:hypothetical protein